MPDAEVQDSGEVFGPSLFTQAAEIAKTEGYSTGTPTTEEVTKLEPEDIKWIPEAIADLAAWKMGAKEVRLTRDEADQLGRLWVKPVQRLCAKIKDLDLIIAVGATATLIVGKALIYAAEHPKQYSDSTGGKGEGKDELVKDSPTPGISVIRG